MQLVYVHPLFCRSYSPVWGFCSSERDIGTFEKQRRSEGRGTEVVGVGSGGWFTVQATVSVRLSGRGGAITPRCVHQDIQLSGREKPAVRQTSHREAADEIFNHPVSVQLTQICIEGGRCGGLDDVCAFDAQEAWRKPTAIMTVPPFGKGPPSYSLRSISFTAAPYVIVDRMSRSWFSD